MQLLSAESVEDQSQRESEPPQRAMVVLEEEKKRKAAQKALAKYYANRDVIRRRRRELWSANREARCEELRRRYRAIREVAGLTVKSVRRKGTRTAEIALQQARSAQARYRESHREQIRARSNRWKQNVKGQPERYSEIVARKADYDKAYREKHKEKRRLYNADPERKKRWNAIRNARYRATHPKPVWQTPEERLEKRRAAGRAHVKKYRDRIREKAKARRQADPLYRLKINLRRRVYDMLSRGNKSASTMELVGCTTEQLRAHLESKFLPGMSWDNYSRMGWHVDHITPLVAFRMDDPAEQRRAFHFSNLQPLWWLDNIRKNSKMPDGRRLTKN